MEEKNEEYNEVLSELSPDGQREEVCKQIDLTETEQDLCGTESVTDRQENLYGTENVTDRQENLYGTENVNVQQENLYGTENMTDRQENLYGTENVTDRQENLYGTENMTDRQENLYETESVTDQQENLYGTENVTDRQENCREYKTDYTPTWESPQKSEKNLAIVVFGVLGVMVAALIILLTIQIQKVSESGVQIRLPFSVEDFAGNPFREKEENPVPELSDDADREENGNTSDAEDSGESVFDKIDWNDTSWKKDHVNHTPQQVGTDYYEDIVDCIDTGVSYQMRRDFYEVKDPEHKISVRLAYTQLQGDIPNLDKINETIKEEALSYAKYYEEQKESYNTYVEENGGGYIATVDSYVTYNSEDLISIVLEESYKNAAGSGYVGLYGFNINTKTGMIYDNTKILQIDQSFALEFKKRSRRQNGPVKEGVDDRSPSEIAGFMRRNENLILFYTPLGMEVGYNYYINGFTGWVTVTFKDYAGYGNDL